MFPSWAIVASIDTGSANAGTALSGHLRYPFPDRHARPGPNVPVTIGIAVALVSRTAANGRWRPWLRRKRGLI